MNETAETNGAESSPRIGVIARMVGTFSSPGTTFASLNRQVEHRDWLIPLIVMAIVAMISAYVIMPIAQTGGMEAASEQIRNDEALSDEDRAQALESMEKVGSIAVVVLAPIGTAASLFILAAIFLALANFILGGSGNYKKTLAVVSYSTLVGIPGAIVTAPLMLAKGSLIVQVGPGLLLPASMEGSYIHHVLTMINLFSIWQYALVAIGLGIIAGVPTKRTACGVFGLWIVYILIAAAAQGLFGNVTGGAG